MANEGRVSLVVWTEIGGLMGNVQFGAPRQLLLHLKQILGIRVLVETGTNEAETSVWASEHFDRIVTIEGFEPLHRKAMAQYSDRDNITFVLGDTRQKLPDVMSKIDEPAIVWLDAHWCGAETFGIERECPVLDEIRAVNATRFDHFILIDDARLFLAPPPLPHKDEDWPEIWEVCALLRERAERFVIVFEDVIIAGPMSARASLVDFIRLKMATDADRAPPAQRSFIRSTLRRLGVR